LSSKPNTAQCVGFAEIVHLRQNRSNPVRCASAPFWLLSSSHRAGWSGSAVSTLSALLCSKHVDHVGEQGAARLCAFAADDGTSAARTRRGCADGPGRYTSADALPAAPQRVVHRFLITPLASLRSSSNCVTSSRHRMKASIADGPGRSSIHRSAGAA